MLQQQNQKEKEATIGSRFD